MSASAPTFLVDECLPFEVTKALRDRGLDVADLFERGTRGLADDAVWKLAATEGRLARVSQERLPRSGAGHTTAAGGRTPRWQNYIVSRRSGAAAWLCAELSLVCPPFVASAAPCD